MAVTAGRWERVADRPGGDVAGLAAVTNDGQTIVFAATAVGIYRSVDGGQTWTLPATAASVAFAEVVAPGPRFAQDRTLFVCAGDTLYRSSDAGESWVPVLVGSRMLSLATALDDTTAGTVVLAGTDTDGILRSADGGRTWTGANAGLLDLTVIALTLSPAFATDRVGFAGTASGLYRTRNGARSWRAVETGLDDPAVQCLAVSPTFAADRLVLAGTEAHGLLRSADGGATWHTPPTMTDRCVTALAFSGNARGTIAAATESGIAISHDGGATWQRTGPEPAEVLSLIFVADDRDEAVLAGLHRRGLARSADCGATWRPANAGLSASLIVGLSLSPAFALDQTLFLAGLHDGVSVSDDGGHTWAASVGWPDDLAAVGLAVSPNYARDQTVFAATPAGVHVSRDAGASWRLATAAAEAVKAVVAAPAPAGSSGVVLAALADGALLVSNDAATTWHALKTDFGPAEIISIVVSPEYARDRTLFVATTSASAPGAGSSGQVTLWRSTDGERWHHWLVAPGRSDTLPLAVAPTFPIDQTVFVGLGGRVLKPLPHAREVRSGKRQPVWRGIDLGGGGAIAVTALAVTPSYAQDRTVFAATNAGVFVSRDAGETYQSWSDGLTPPRTIALAISPTYAEDHLVYGLGVGGTLWRRRDVATASSG